MDADRTTKTATTPPTREISLHTYKPLYIDAMVQMFYFGNFKFEYPLKYKFVEYKDVLNEQQNPQEGVPLTVLYLGVYSLGKDLYYEELCKVSLGHLQQALLAAPIGIDIFIQLKKRVWEGNQDLINRNPSFMYIEGEGLEIRRLLSTYAAQWDPVWQKSFPTLWQLHTTESGQNEDFAYCHRKALKALSKVTTKSIKMIKCYLDEEETGSEDKTSEVQE